MLVGLSISLAHCYGTTAINYHHFKLPAWTSARFTTSTASQTGNTIVTSETGTEPGSNKGAMIRGSKTD